MPAVDLEHVDDHINGYNLLTACQKWSAGLQDILLKLERGFLTVTNSSYRHKDSLRSISW